MNLCSDEIRDCLLNFWQCLNKVNRVTFRTKNGTEWKASGDGQVSITQQGNSALIFTEHGIWHETTLRFNNVLRWTLNKDAEVISLEHLRKGIDDPVFLVHLEPCEKNKLVSKNAHLCNQDSYFASAYYDQTSIHLNWQIKGPKKSAELHCCYSAIS